MRGLALLTVILLLASNVFGQHARQYSFKHFSVSNGLASNNVTSVIQDGDGYIWMATANGLQRYDGNTFLTFKSKEGDPSSIPGTHISGMHLDNRNNLWLIGANYRIGIFDTRKMIFREVPIQGRKQFIGGMNFVQLPTGELILKVDKLLYQYRPLPGIFVPVDNLFPLPANWGINGIYYDTGTNRYWLSCDSGFVKFDPKTGSVSYRGHNAERDPVIEAFKNERNPVSIISDAKGNMIYSFWRRNEGSPGIYRYNVSRSRLDSFRLWEQTGYHEIYGLLKQRNGRLWIYGHPFFMEWTEEQIPFTHLSGSNSDEPPITFDYTYHAFEDREHNIWMATDNGVYQFNPDAQVFNTYALIRPGEKSAKEAAVQAVMELPDGKILVGTWGSTGIYCFDRNLNPSPLPAVFGASAKTCSVWDMAFNGKTGDLWITLQDGGLMIYNQKKNKLTEVYPEIFGRSTIRQADEDTAGNIWFGTQSGKLIKWDLAKSGGDPTKGYQLILETGQTYKVHYDYSGYIWVATNARGLVKVNVHTGLVEQTFKSTDAPGRRLFSDSPTDMTYFDDSTLIVTAGCLNIINTKRNTVRFFTLEDGLPSNTAQSVEKDNNGTLWVGMLNGICRIKLEKGLVSYYDRRDGIAYDKFAMAGVQELDDGKLVFFTDHNFLVFNPKLFGQMNRPPKPQISSLQLGGKPLTIDSLLRAGRIVLSYENTSLNIGFSALTYLQQTKVHYYYMLENLDKDWIHTDKPLEVNYNYLPPGNYTFRVKSENADGIVSHQEASLVIVVRPPFWNTWWFYALVLLLIITILYVIDKERMARKSSLRQMRSQIAGNLHTEVNNTLNSINVLSEIAKIKADKNIEQSKEFINQISTKSRSMIEAMDDMLWSIDPMNDSMQKTVMRIKELTENMRSTYNIDIDLIVDRNVQKLELDMKLRHDFYFYYKEALQFVAEHIRCTQVFVNINQVKSRITIEIIAECNTITEELLERYRKVMASRVELLRGGLDVLADHQSFSAVLYVNI